MTLTIVLVTMAAFVGAFVGVLAARALPDLMLDLRERSKLQSVLPEQTFKDNWGGSVPGYLWKKHGPHLRRRGR